MDLMGSWLKDGIPDGMRIGAVLAMVKRSVSTTHPEYDSEEVHDYAKRKG